jgi:aerobic carbon-monoxide dehydrogenase medium subunit
MATIKHYERPKTLADAVTLLQAKRGAAAILGGGTSLTLRVPPAVDTLVDLSDLGLSGIEDRGDSTAILACTTIAELAESKTFQDRYGGMLARAANRVASTPLRNAITVGGNAFAVFPWSDLPAVFLALDASVVVTGKQQRVIPIGDFYAQHPRVMLAAGDIVTEIRVPKPIGRVDGSFVKVTKTRFDYAALSVAVVCHFNGPQVQHCTVALGSVRPLPLRVPQAEEEIAGKVPTREDIIRAAARAAGAIDPSQDFRYSQDYRRHLIKVWVKRCLHEVLG